MKDCRGGLHQKNNPKDNPKKHWVVPCLKDKTIVNKVPFTKEGNYQ